MFLNFELPKNLRRIQKLSDQCFSCDVSDKHFVNPIPNNQHFYLRTEKEVFEILEHLL